MSILFKFPSRQRAEKCLSVLDNIKSLARSEDYRIMLTLDYDDESMTDYDIVRRIVQYHNNAFINWGKSNSKIHAVNRGMELSGDWDILVVVSDDFEFLQEGFDLQIIKDMEENFPDTDGVLHYPDGTPNAKRLMTMNIFGRKYYERTGWIYHPDFWSVYADDFNTLYAKHLNKYKFIDNLLFRHNHYLFNMSEADDLNIFNDSRNMYQHDLSVFNELKIKYEIS